MDTHSPKGVTSMLPFKRKGKRLENGSEQEGPQTLSITERNTTIASYATLMLRRSIRFIIAVTSSQILLF